MSWSNPESPSSPILGVLEKWFIILHGLCLCDDQTHGRTLFFPDRWGRIRPPTSDFNCINCVIECVHREVYIGPTACDGDQHQETKFQTSSESHSLGSGAWWAGWSLPNDDVVYDCAARGSGEGLLSRDHLNAVFSRRT